MPIPAADSKKKAASKNLRRGVADLLTLWLEKVACYAPNFEKVGSILLWACPSICPSVQKKFKARVLKFLIWIPRQKIAYPYFFSCLNYLPLPSYAPFKG